MPQRQLDPFDDRVVCVQCSHLASRRRCTNWRAAHLDGPEVGALVELPQRCMGYLPSQTTKTEAKTDSRPKPCNQPTEELKMSLTIAEASTTDYTPPEAGTFTARCTSVIDLGTQKTVWEGEEKQAHKVLLSFELTDAENRRADGSPHTVSKRFTASLHAKAALRKFLESWRGRPFTPQELAGFDVKNVLGLPCLVGIVHEAKGEKVYANLASVMKLPKGMPAGAGELEAEAFDLAAPEWQVYAGLSSRLQTQIAESPEFAALPNKPKSVSVGAPLPSPSPVPKNAATAHPAPLPGHQPAPAVAGSGFDDFEACPF